jgi:hypothetical protein
MAIILEFPVRLPKVLAEVSPNAPRANAEIVLFPGIRYEHRIEPPPGARPPQDHSGKRSKRSRRKA